MTTAEIAIIRPRTSWTSSDASGVVEDPVVDPGSGRRRDRRRGEDRERPEPVQREREHELRRRALDEPGQQRVGAPLAAEQRRHAGRDHLREQRRAGLADDVAAPGRPARARRRTAGPSAGGANTNTASNAAPGEVPGPEHDAEATPMIGRHDDVARPPRVSTAGAPRSGSKPSSPSIPDLRQARTPPPMPGTACCGCGPASYTGTNRIRFRGSVVCTTLSALARSPEADLRLSAESTPARSRTMPG